MIDAKDGSRVEAGVGHWVVVSVDHIATVDQKAALAKAYWAHAVDMEAAAVAGEEPRPTTSPSLASK